VKWKGWEQWSTCDFSIGLEFHQHFFHPYFTVKDNSSYTEPFKKTWSNTNVYTSKANLGTTTNQNHLAGMCTKILFLVFHVYTVSIQTPIKSYVVYPHSLMLWLHECIPQLIKCFWQWQNVNTSFEWSHSHNPLFWSLVIKKLLNCQVVQAPSHLPANLLTPKEEFP